MRSLCADVLRFPRNVGPKASLDEHFARVPRDFIAAPRFDIEVVTARDHAWPRISVVIPSFNKRAFIEKALLSVLNQNYPNLECIVIDGGSTDGTLQAIEAYRPYLAAVVSEPDRGQSDALNKGFRLATGDLVNELDADDVFLPGAFRAVAGVFRGHPDADVIFGHRLDIDEHDRVVGRCLYTKFSRIVYRYDGMCIGPQSAFWKRGLFAEVGMYDLGLHLAMDYDFFMRVARWGARFRFVPQYFSAMRRYEGSKTTALLDTPVHRAEWDDVQQRYPVRRWLKPPLKVYALAFRSFHYVWQGDGDYVWAGLRRRLRSGGLFSGR